MTWIGNNWIWIAAIAAMMAIHLRCGGHSGHRRMSHGADHSNSHGSTHDGHATIPPPPRDQETTTAERPRR